MGFSVNVDGSKLSEAIDERIKWMDRTAEGAAVTSAFFVACRAKELMPVTDIGTIDTELAVEVIPVIGKRGKPLKNKKDFASRPGGDSRTAGVAMGKMIVLARANLLKSKPSFYNTSTHNRYALSPNDLKGKGTIEKLISQMIKGRHSGTHFLQIGWNPAIKILKASPHLVQKYRRGGPPTETSRFDYSSGTDKGSAVIQLFGDSCLVTIENAIGGEGLNAQSHREALLRVGEPGLQQAIDEETASMIEWMERHSKIGDDRFNQKAA